MMGKIFETVFKSFRFLGICMFVFLLTLSIAGYIFLSHVAVTLDELTFWMYDHPAVPVIAGLALIVLNVFLFIKGTRRKTKTFKVK